MTLQEFISLWQAQPFRAFRMHTRRGEFIVNNPMCAALTPQMRVAIVVDDTRVETLSLNEIEQCEPFGEPMSLAEALAAVPSETLSGRAQLLSAALAASALGTGGQATGAFDQGKIVLLPAPALNGVDVMHVTVQARDGQTIFSTADTRWNLHGVEQFENGTSLYLHHLDHPAAEQRIMLWPPDKGTFESYAEALPPSHLEKELHRRDAALAAKPAKPVEPPAVYFREIMVKWPIAEKDGWEEAFGADPPSLDPARFEFVLVPRTVSDSRQVRNPCLTDIMKEEIIFNLVDTDWDATGEQEKRNWHLALSHASSFGRKTTLHVDVDRRAATVDEGGTLLSLGWIERHLRNFALYELWEPMIGALLAGPVKRKHPDVVIPIAGGFNAALWAGEPRFPAPFLQPHIVDSEGRTILDLRATTWSAAILADAKRPVVTLVFSSGVQETPRATNPYPLDLDLVTHRVTCPNLKGSTTIGMIQSMVRRISGMKWMLEELPKWFAKGQSLEDFQ